MCFSKNVPLLFLLIFLFSPFYTRESREVTPLFLRNGGFLVIITFLRVRQFLSVGYSHICGSICIASESELIDDVCL